MTTDGSFLVFDAHPRQWVGPQPYYDGATGRLVTPDTVTVGADYLLVGRVVRPLIIDRDSPLGRVWDDGDDDIFSTTPAPSTPPREGSKGETNE